MYWGRTLCAMDLMFVSPPNSHVKVLTHVLWCLEVGRKLGLDEVMKGLVTLKEKPCEDTAG